MDRRAVGDRQPSPLWSLPAEIRRMIWKYTAEDTPVMLFGVEYSRDDPSFPIKVAARILSPEEVDQTCGLHPDPKSVEGKQLLSLSWLRASKFIYEEARPVVLSSTTLHICDPIVLSTFSSQISDSTRQLIHSIELGLKLDTTIGLSRVKCAWTFLFSWPMGHRGAGDVIACRCPWCMHGASDQLDLNRYFSSLRKLQMKIFFQCDLPMQTPSVDQLRHWGTRTGFIRDEQRIPLPMVRTSRPDRVAFQVNTICRFFADGKAGPTVQTVEVRFVTKRIEHDRRMPLDECWCPRYCITLTGLEECDMAGKIEHCLPNGLNAWDECYPAWKETVDPETPGDTD